MKTDKKLDALRKKIDRADRLLLQAFSARFRAVKGIAKVKRAAKIPIVQAGRWKEVLRTRLAQGRRLGLSDRFIRLIFAAIHEEAVRLQRSRKK